MTTARRAARVVESTPTSEVPPELLAGPCLEVWGTGDPLVAERRWSDARRAWLAARGLSIYDHYLMPDELVHPWRRTSRCTPWSFEALRRRDPAGVADRLARLGLPRGWTPALAHPVDYGPSLLPDRFTYRLWRARRATEHRPYEAADPKED